MVATIIPFVDRVICGDCISVMQNMPSRSVDLIVADPPYIENYKTRDGRRVFSRAPQEWIEPAFRELGRVLKPDRFCVSFYGWPWIELFMAAWKKSGFRPVSHLVWIKSYPSRSGYTRSHHEAAYLLTKGRPPKSECPSKDVLEWDYTDNRHHPTEKPVSAINSLIESFSQPGDIVLDPFAGSGTTGVAAQKCDRRFILIEISGEHCQTARARLNHTSLPATRPSALPVRE